MQAFSSLADSYMKHTKEAIFCPQLLLLFSPHSFNLTTDPKDELVDSEVLWAALLCRLAALVGGLRLVVAPM